MVLPTHMTTVKVPASPDEMLAQFGGHFDNLAAATKSGALDATTIMQYAEIEFLLTTIKNAFRSNSYAAATAIDSTPFIPPAEAKLCISQLEAAICNN